MLARAKITVSNKENQENRAKNLRFHLFLVIYYTKINIPWVKLTAQNVLYPQMYSSYISLISGTWIYRPFVPATLQDTPSLR